MAEEKKSIPKPTIKNSPPEKPPVTSLDFDEPEPQKVEKEKDSTSEPVVPSDGVETDLVKRLLGVLIDGVVAGFIAFIVLKITGSSFLNYAVMGLVMLTRDSLPFLEGQSLGKKVMKTKAVKEDGSSLAGDWVTGATRNILFAVPVAGVVECFTMLSRSGNAGAGKRLGDDWAKTKVISVD